jgi:UTP-glucose-1-phosphate uridylyltransferase
MRYMASNGTDAVIAAQPVDHTDIASFGVVDTHPDDPGRVVGIRQRPDPATVRVPLAVVSRLILRPSIFDLLVPTERADGEIDLGVAVGEPEQSGSVAFGTLADGRTRVAGLVAQRTVHTGKVATRRHREGASVGGVIAV